MGNFNFKDLILSDSYRTTAASTDDIGKIQVRSPGKMDFFRVHPSDEYSAQFLILENPREKKTYLVSAALEDALQGDAFRAMVALCANQHGEKFLFVAKLPSYGGESYATTRLEAMDLARTEWVRLRNTPMQKGYEIVKATSSFPEPNWPAETFECLLGQAFENRVVNSSDHPMVKKLLGEMA